MKFRQLQKFLKDASSWKTILSFWGLRLIFNGELLLSALVRHGPAGRPGRRLWRWRLKALEADTRHPWWSCRNKNGGKNYRFFFSSHWSNIVRMDGGNIEARGWSFIVSSCTIVVPLLSSGFQHHQYLWIESRHNSAWKNAFIASISSKPYVAVAYIGCSTTCRFIQKTDENFRRIQDCLWHILRMGLQPLILLMEEILHQSIW